MKKSKFVFVLILIVCMCMPAIAQKGKNSLVKQMTTNQFKAQIWNYSSDKEWKILRKQTRYYRFICRLVSTLS